MQALSFPKLKGSMILCWFPPAYTFRFADCTIIGIKGHLLVKLGCDCSGLIPSYFFLRRGDGFAGFYGVIKWFFLLPLAGNTVKCTAPSCAFLENTRGWEVLWILWALSQKICLKKCISSCMYSILQTAMISLLYALWICNDVLGVDNFPSFRVPSSLLLERPFPVTYIDVCGKTITWPLVCSKGALLVVPACGMGHSCDRCYMISCFAKQTVRGP